MFLFARCLYLLVKIFIKVKNGLMMNPEVEKRSICVWLLYCVINFCRFANGGVKMSIVGNREQCLKSFWLAIVVSYV